MLTMSTIKYILLTFYFCVIQCWMDILKSTVLLTHAKAHEHCLSCITLEISASIKSAIGVTTVLFFLKQDHCPTGRH
jgi:hypothetical protein